MRRIYPLLIAVAAIALPNLTSGQTVTSDPVGFETTTILSGRTGGISLPLDNIADFAGPVSSHTTNTITTTGATFPSFTSTPHVVRMLAGTSVGRQFQIASNTATTITLTTNLTTIADGDRYEVIAVHTLLTFFGAGAPTLSHNTANPADSTVVDNVLIRGTSGWLTYFYDDVLGRWLRVSGGSTDRGNTTLLLPDQGFLVVRRAATDLTLTVTGAVPTTHLVTDLPNNKTTTLPNRFPTATTLAALGLHNQGAWIKDTSSASPNPDADDRVLIRGTSGWLSYYYVNQTTPSTLQQWQRVSGGTANRDNTLVDIGTSVLIDRRAGADIALDQTPPYTLP
jgi:uncharacterized protein (TIGR02597 family)